MGSYTPPTDLTNILVPTLVMRGSKADADMSAAADAVTALIPHAQLRILPKQTHQVKAAAVAPVVKDHFTAHSDAEHPPRTTEARPAEPKPRSRT